MVSLLSARCVTSILICDTNLLGFYGKPEISERRPGGNENWLARIGAVSRAAGMVTVTDPNYGVSRPSPWRLLGWVSVCAVLWGSTFPGIKLVYGHWAEQGVVVNFSTRSLFAGVRFVVAGMGLLLLARAPRRELRERRGI